MPPTFRPMTAADIPFGMRLKTEAGWNQTEADWRRFLALSQGGTLVAERDGAAVGTVATFLFGPIGWVAMLLVGKRWRHQGIGGSLLQCAVALLKDRGASTIRLDATPLGRPMYAVFGFQAEYDLGGSRTPRAAAEEMATGLVDRSSLPADRQVTGTPPSRCSRAGRGTIRIAPDRRDNKHPAGYWFTRPGSRAVRIGRRGMPLRARLQRGCQPARGGDGVDRHPEPAAPALGRETRPRPPAVPRGCPANLSTTGWRCLGQFDRRKAGTDGAWIFRGSTELSVCGSERQAQAGPRSRQPNLGYSVRQSRRASSGLLWAASVSGQREV